MNLKYAFNYSKKIDVFNEYKQIGVIKWGK